jgi:hypothetical protein
VGEAPESKKLEVVGDKVLPRELLLMLLMFIGGVLIKRGDRSFRSGVEEAIGGSIARSIVLFIKTNKYIFAS